MKPHFKDEGDALVKGAPPLVGLGDWRAVLRGDIEEAVLKVTRGGKRIGRGRARLNSLRNREARAPAPIDNAPRRLAGANPDTPKTRPMGT